MSYLVVPTIQLATQIVVASPASMKNPQVTQVVLDQLNAQINPNGQPGSPIQGMFFQYLDQQFGAQWRNQGGVQQVTMENAIKAWLPGIFAGTEKALMQQQPWQQPQMFHQPQGYNQGGWMSPTMVNPSRGMFDLGGGNPQPQQQHYAPPPQTVVQPVQQAPVQQYVQPTQNFKEGREIVLEMRSEAVLAVDKPENEFVEFHHYKTCEFDGMRYSTCKMHYLQPENSSRFVAIRSISEAPQQVIRGLFANVVDFEQLFHIRMKHERFFQIAKEVRAAYLQKNDWREAMAVIATLTKNEWATWSFALTNLINEKIHRRLRNSNNDLIISIDDLDDLTVLDDRHSTWPVAQHPKYWTTLNHIVGEVFDILTDPKNLIMPDDQNFGDFVHCEDVKFRRDGRGKYDYGTFADPVDRRRFTDLLLATNTVLRIPRKILVTNALDMNLVAQIVRLDPDKQIFLRDLNIPGTKLLETLEEFHHIQLESIHCMNRDRLFGAFTSINASKTLDDDLIFVN